MLESTRLVWAVSTSTSCSSQQTIPVPRGPLTIRIPQPPYLDWWRVAVERRKVLRRRSTMRCGSQRTSSCRSFWSLHLVSFQRRLIPIADLLWSTRPEAGKLSRSFSAHYTLFKSSLLCSHFIGIFAEVLFVRYMLGSLHMGLGEKDFKATYVNARRFNLAN